MNAAYLPILVALSSPSPVPAPAGLAYEAPSGCPARPEFVAAVTARGADVVVGDEAASARLMVVSIHRGASGFDGAFQVRESDGSATRRREVHGSTCAVVADALAVVTAIELRPTESDAPSAPPRPPPTRAPTTTAADPPAPPRDADRLIGHTPFFPPRTESVLVQAGELRFDLSRSVAVHAGATAGLVPSVLLPHYDLVIGLASFVTAPEGAQRITGPVLQLHAGFIGPSTYRSPDTRTDIYGMSFGIDICASPHYDSKSFVLLLCGEYGGGLLSLTTKNPDGSGARQKDSGFGVIGAVIDAQYHFSSHLYAGFRLSGGFTVGDVVADRADGSRIFKSAPWSTTVMAGIGVRY